MSFESMLHVEFVGNIGRLDTHTHVLKDNENALVYKFQLSFNYQTYPKQLYEWLEVHSFIG